MDKIAVIGGARPNFMKILPLTLALKESGFDFLVINTGQHFSKDMSDNFLQEFGLKMDYNLNPSKNSTAEQMIDMMAGLEDIFLKEKPELVIVVGDVNSTLAGATVAHKLKIKLAHVEAGLRSYNPAMPEENNRIMTDHISDLLFAPSAKALANLTKENIKGRTYVVGNIMIDTLKIFLPRIPTMGEEFYFCTLHRAENISSKEIFSEILAALFVIAQDRKIYFTLHPHTKKKAEEFGLLSKIEKNFELLPPLSYFESLKFQNNAKLVLTDSGGIQEETSFLGVPCLTLRNETERPITVELGTNTLAGTTKDSILTEYKKKNLDRKKTQIPLWDGETSKRIIKILKNEQSK